MKEAMDKMIGNQKEIVSFFNQQVLEANRTILKNQELFQLKATETEKLMKGIYDQMDSKAKLKSRFLTILNSYIKTREELGSFKGREKEELAESGKQLENL
jgi:uncharacterized protein (DUF1778 family)